MLERDKQRNLRLAQFKRGIEILKNLQPFEEAIKAGSQIDYQEIVPANTPYPDRGVSFLIDKPMLAMIKGAVAGVFNECCRLGLREEIHRMAKAGELGEEKAPELPPVDPPQD